ncbi:TOBE domain-containing protein [Franzmannia qiaohouensis]|uniref:TOBE domain-containing protein n=1 Tax=Franzmannia qiaohouensis TaxID=1329370 RepID=A0ABU1HBT2_9GAMM|nr:TOBE domain-containing protein [Halomonas qiaohouensis]MDR5904929.1 TOBE domain-containing protein [Halomonas qiaohouensis]
MQISARNNWPAIVDNIDKGPVSTEIQLRLDSGDAAVATITTASANSLSLVPGVRVRVLVKASSVMVLAGDGADVGISARNCLSGQVTQVEHGAVQSIVALRTTNGTEITASITKASAEKLGLVAGKPAAALVKASDVLILSE